MIEDKKFFITTAIDYVNGLPHIGHALEKIQADVVARYHRLQDYDVFFLTGTDENSLKSVQAAEKAGLEVNEWVDDHAEIFCNLRGALNLSFDDFIRTTEPRHIAGVEKLWKLCEKDLYKKTYEGLYCVGCEAFYKEEELEDGMCPEHKKPLELVKEENYFFRLSKYQNKLKDLIEKDEFKIIPETRKNEILSFINSGLEDICVSRSKERARGWGIPVPGDDSQIIWVWFDALANYITAAGFGNDEELFEKLWPADMHIVGKGILRFHAVHWPAILLSAGLELPKLIFSHGYITVDGMKMSKSIGNVINPYDLVEKYGTDPVRYFLLREMPSTGDGDFTYEKFEERYSADLAKGLGNLTSRVITLAKDFDFQFDASKKFTDNELREVVMVDSWKTYRKKMDELKFNEALVAIWSVIGACDKIIEKEKPWEKKNGWEKVVEDLLLALFYIAKMLKPFLPETSDKILEQISTKKAEAIFPQL
ncbi:MAG: methionine--tRNA ligase [Patescibacteria group bacterium]